MTRIRSRGLFPAASFVLALGLVAGCGKPPEATAPAAGQGPPMPGPGGPPGPPPEEVLAGLPGGDEFAAGKKVYAHNGCANCHKLGETGRGKGGRGPGGPDLTTTGANPEHTARWLADHVRDPKLHKPESRMPAYGADKIGDADLTALAEYLAGRK